MQFQPQWSQRLQGPVQGVALAREADGILAWDQGNWLYLFNHAGQRQAQVRFPASILHAAYSDDGSAILALAAEGFFWLGPDLSVRRQQPLANLPLALAVDPFGQYAVAADSRGHAQIFDHLGRKVAQLSLPRSFHHVAFVPAAPLIVGCADYGLVGCFDMHGELVWRNGLVAHVGGLAVAGDASNIVAACFSEGLQRYDLAGKDLGRVKTGQSCRLVSMSFDGRRLLLAGAGDSVELVDADGKELGNARVEQPTAVALGALGDYAIVGSGSGTIRKLTIT